jgi:cytoskeletal protein RodZ
MKKTNTRPTGFTSHKFIIIVFIVLVLGAICFIALHYYPRAKPSDTTTNGPTKEEVVLQEKTASQQKEAFLDKTANTTTPTPGLPPTSSNSVSAIASMTAAKQDQTVIILTKLQNVSAGTCTLTIKNGARSSTVSANVMYQPEFSSCSGFSVPVSSVGVGSWDITLTVSPSSGGASLEKTIKLQVT